MTRLSLFNSPLLLGFDQFERAVDRVSKAASDGYPPYNVEQLGENRLRITVAVAGFSAEELEVQVEDSQLVIRGKRHEEPGKAYLHQGIAARQFQRSFVLAEGIEVMGASLDKGLLSVELERPILQPKVRNIAIETGNGQAASVSARRKGLRPGPEEVAG